MRDERSFLERAMEAFHRINNASSYPHAHPPPAESEEQELYERGIELIHEASRNLEDARRLSEIRRKQMIDNAIKSIEERTKP